MKTTNNVQKTENRKFRKVITSSLIFIGLAASSLNLFASNSANQNQVLNTFQENKLEYATYNHLSMAGFAMDAIASRTYFIESAKDKNLEIENWMTSDKYFSTAVFVDELSPEQPLRIESWMTDVNNFMSPENLSDTEKPARIEKWMVDNMIWNNQK